MRNYSLHDTAAELIKTAMNTRVEKAEKAIQSLETIFPDSVYF